jgi:microcystin-dependent protein
MAAGEIRIVAFDFAPEGWQRCDGRELYVAQYRELYNIIGTTYGGDGKMTFRMPDYRPVVVGKSAKFPSAKASTFARGSSGSDRPAYVALHYIIPTSDRASYDDPYIGEVRAVGFDYNPKDWMECNGALIPISRNTALFSLLGNRYGGDARQTFAVPDLRGRALVSSDETHPLASTFGHEIEEGTGADVSFVAVRYVICVSGMFPARPY